MDPYRPLYIADERVRDEPVEHDDRVLAVLLIVLGLARVIPAVCRGDELGAEVTTALLMLVGGLAIVVRAAFRHS